MKSLFILLSLHVIAVMTAKGQRNFSLSTNKPVIDLKKLIAATTIKLPDDRRKSSIFPKNPQKFVVTSKPYSKVRTYTPRPMVMTKKIFMPVYKPNISPKDTVTILPSVRSFDSVVEWPAEVPSSRIHRRLVEEKHVNNNMGYKITQDKGLDSDNQITDDSEEISTGLPEFAEDALTNDLDNNIQVDFNTLSELDNMRTKRLAVHGPTVHDSWYFKNIARVPKGSHEVDDEDEFIFLNNKKPLADSQAKSSRSMKISSIEPTSSTSQSSRAKRNNNIIEEEFRLTTVSGYNSGREPRLGSDLVFKNIHA